MTGTDRAHQLRVSGRGWQVVLPVLLIGLTGTILLVSSHAATPISSAEAEGGSLAGAAKSVADATASSGPAVAFGSASATCPSSQCMPTGDITDSEGSWHQIFAEDFTKDAPLGGFPGTLYSDTWGSYGPDWPDTNKNGVYNSSKTLSVAGGALDIYLHTENGVHYVAAPVPLISTWSQTYGRYAVRFRTDSLKGYHPAWLLWPANEVWDDGEIDFPEGELDGNISVYVHCVGTGSPQNNCFMNETSTPFAGGWHTAVTEWSPGRVAFYLDGKSLGVATGSTSVPTTPMYATLQTETSYTAPADNVAGHVQVDWYTIYSRK